ncbi:MAG TPA: helix-turn-helix transcriptional regulator [Candidatus Angelobacter sp.]|nr:helix-turn-helix transcriptional regulator [Candidatus Angelobacter sp.]
MKDDKKNDIIRLVGERIKNLRHNQGISQEKLADLSGLHRSHMGQIERGESNVTLRTLWRVGNALEVAVVELVKGIR